MDVLNIYFRFIEVLNSHQSWDMSEGKMNDLEVNEATQSLKKIISAFNDFSTKYLKIPSLVEFGFIHETRKYCEEVNSNYDDINLFYSHNGTYNKISHEIDHHLYKIVTNLCWHAIGEGATSVVIGVAATEKNLQISFDTTIPCFVDIETSEAILVNLAMDSINKAKGEFFVNNHPGNSHELILYFNYPNNLTNGKTDS